MKVKIYTRTGDKGTTSLFSGERVPKNDVFIEALGAVDEANSAIGMALSFIPQEAELQTTRKQLEVIQHALFDVGAALATPLSCKQEKKKEKTRFDYEGVELLEKWIDEMEEKLPALHQFILPGGHPAGAALHLSRSLIRKSERCVIPLYEQEMVVPAVLIYLNRLSDYLFVVSRFINHALQVPEITWKAHQHIVS